MKYPNQPKHIYQKKVTTTLKDVRKAHLGQDFEKIINDSNDYYRQKDVAIIHKKPVPIQITKVSYPGRNQAKITEAFYQIPSTTDYNGIYNGYYIDFEAKSCLTNTFVLKRLYQHQIDHLCSVNRHGGVAFLLIMFRQKHQVFILPLEPLLCCYEKAKTDGPKSINYQFVLEHGYLVPIGYTPQLDYLKIIDLLIEKKGERNVV